jgi:3-oxoacyl-[acyl-carrier protein] reductase
MNLKDKLVLITGAASGIGRATAVACSREGCTVLINFKSDVKAAQTALKECNKYSAGNAILRADIANEGQVQAMFRSIKKKFFRLDVLVNNAGIFDEKDAYDNIVAFENIYRNNFLSHVMVTKYAAELMKKGKIINISSIHGRLGQGRPDAIAYGAFKAALENYTENLAKKLAPRILVNAVAPGRVATPMWGKLDSKQNRKLGAVHLIQRMIEPREVADAILFLLKNDAMCGEILTIDGGYNLVSRD